MNSVEMDELLHDGGNRLASQEQIDAEHAEARSQARERVEMRIQKRDWATQECISDDVVPVLGEYCRLLLWGRRDEARAMLEKAVEDAVEALVEAEL